MVARPSERECTPQERAFVMAWIETGSMTEAYAKAYKTQLKGQALNASAKKVARRTPVRLLYDELVAKHQKRHEVTVARIVEEYAKLGFANMLDYMTIQPDGTAFCDLSKLTREQAAAIQETTTETVMMATGEEDEDGKAKRVTVLKTRIKLADKKAALLDLGKYLGMFEADNKQKGEAEAAAHMAAAERSDVDVARRLAFLLAKAQKTAKPKQEVTSG